MIDIKTLRIGSHVEYNGKRVRVALVREDGCICECKDNGQDVIIGLGVEKQPIPITPELLAELGFKIETCGILPEGEFWRHNLKDNPIEVTCWGQLPNSRDRDWSVRVDNSDNDGLGSGDVAYLHELENIIYQCTGIELIEE